MNNLEEIKSLQMQLAVKKQEKEKALSTLLEKKLELLEELNSLE